MAIFEDNQVRSVFLLLRLLKERAHGQQDGGTDDAGVGDVEGGPGVEGGGEPKSKRRKTAGAFSLVC
jgi:hypothetical protein